MADRRESMQVSYIGRVTLCLSTSTPVAILETVWKETCGTDNRWRSKASVCAGPGLWICGVMEHGELAKSCELRVPWTRDGPDLSEGECGIMSCWSSTSKYRACFDADKREMRYSSFHFTETANFLSCHVPLSALFPSELAVARSFAGK